MSRGYPAICNEAVIYLTPWKTLFRTDQVENANFLLLNIHGQKAKLLCIPWVALLASKPSEWLRLFFVPKHFVILIIVHQTNTGHQAVSIYNESNAQNKFTFKCWSCHAFDVVHQLSSFCALCFAIFADEVVHLIFVLQTFYWNLSPICLFPSFFTWNILKHLLYFVLWKVYC